GAPGTGWARLWERPAGPGRDAARAGGSGRGSGERQSDTGGCYGVSPGGSPSPPRGGGAHWPGPGGPRPVSGYGAITNSATRARPTLVPCGCTFGGTIQQAKLGSHGSG